MLPKHHQHHHLTTLLLSLTSPSHLLQLHAHLILTSSPLHPIYFNTLFRHHPSPLLLLRLLLRLPLRPDHFTFPYLLSSLSHSPPHLPPTLHSLISKFGLLPNPHVSSSLLRLYFLSRNPQDARMLFDCSFVSNNVVSWTVLVSGYFANGMYDQAMEVFDKMPQWVKPNEVTLVHVLSACGKAGDLARGRRVHELVKRGSCDVRSNVVLDTAVVDMYGRCGCLVDAREVFDGMSERNLVSWNAMMSGYNRWGRFDESFGLFREMLRAGLRPDKVNLLGLLVACARKGVLRIGRGMHGFVLRNARGDEDGEVEVEVWTSVLDMYAKCGDTRSAREVFERLKRKDLLAWTTMIVGLSSHGKGKEAVVLFRRMVAEGVIPDKISFIGVLNGCSHAGLVEEGWDIFSSMRQVYGLEPGLEHYGCVVDLLSRAGRLKEAEEVVREMPIKAGVEIWGAVLRGCDIHGNVELAEKAGREIAEFDPSTSGVYVLLSNVYAGVGKWEGVERVRRFIKNRGLEKNVGRSCVEA